MRLRPSGLELLAVLVLALSLVAAQPAGPLPYRNAGTVMVADQSAWALDGDGAPLADERLYRVSEDDPCRITLTSGTTGEARGVAFSHKAVAAKNARLAFARGNRFPQCSRFYCDLGLATDPGFRDMLHMLSKGGTIFYYGGDAESLIQAIDLYKIQAMIAAPSGLAEYLKFFEAYSDVACGFDHILTSGASLSRSLSERVRARMCANLYSTYGSTETGGVAVAPAPTRMDPASSPTSWRTARTPASARRSVSSAWRRKTRPASASSTPLAVRWTSSAPTSASSFLSMAERAGWETPKARAARVMCPAWAMAR